MRNLLMFFDRFFNFMVGILVVAFTALEISNRIKLQDASRMSTKQLFDKIMAEDA